MSGDPAEAWRNIAERMTRYSGHLARTKSVYVNSKALRGQTVEIAEGYFRDVRPLLVQSGLNEIIDPMDGAFQRLLEMAQGQSATSAYKKYAKQIRKLSPKITSRLALGLGAVKSDERPSGDDTRIIETLSDMVPSAAASYRQALFDLADATRVSFRGPALELRESLRETLDHLAPDDEVMGADGFKLEKDRTKPTMKQKVRFILKARGQSKSSSVVPEDTAIAIDAMVADLTRSVYDKSSLASHVATSHRNVGQIKMYVGALLHDILEL